MCSRSICPTIHPSICPITIQIKLSVVSVLISPNNLLILMQLQLLSSTLVSIINILNVCSSLVVRRWQNDHKRKRKESWGHNNNMSKYYQDIFLAVLRTGTWPIFEWGRLLWQIYSMAEKASTVFVGDTAIQACNRDFSRKEKSCSITVKENCLM